MPREGGRRPLCSREPSPRSAARRSEGQRFYLDQFLALGQRGLCDFLREDQRDSTENCKGAISPRGRGPPRTVQDFRRGSVGPRERRPLQGEAGQAAAALPMLDGTEGGPSGAGSAPQEGHSSGPDDPVTTNKGGLGDRD